MTTTDPTAAPQPATPGEAIDASAADVPPLLTEVRRLRAELERTKAAEVTPELGAAPAPVSDDVRHRNALDAVVSLARHWASEPADSPHRYRLRELAQTLRETIHRAGGGDVLDAAPAADPSVVPSPPAEDGDGTPAVRLVTLPLCDLCASGAGGECHVPGCALYMNRAPDRPLSTTPPTGEDTAVAVAIGEDGTAYLDDDTQVPAGEWEPAGTESA